MKAWRKHNMQMAATIKELEREREIYVFSGGNKYYKAIIQQIDLKIKQAKNFMLKTKLERRTHFQSEVQFPSNLLLAMYKRVGLTTPEIMP